MAACNAQQTYVADYHMHSVYSDGSLTPAQLVEQAAAQGIRHMAVSDHDTLAGVPEALEAGTRCGVKVVTAIEFSVLGEMGLHMLGYGMNIDDPKLAQVQQLLEQQRFRRAEAVVQRLNTLGCPVTLERVQQIAGVGTIGRPHIAQALIEAGCCRSFSEAFQRYLRTGAPAYVPRERMSADECIRLVRDCGGMAALAHPGLLPTAQQNLYALVRSLVQRGMEGLEVYYPGHSAAQVQLLKNMADEFHITVTGGSDFHGAPKPAIRMGAGTQHAPRGWDEPFRRRMGIYDQEDDA